MKLIHSLATVIALSFFATPLMRAQELETPTEKPSPTPAEAAEPAASVTPTAKASPAAKSEKPKSSPAAKVSPATSPAQKPVAKGSVESQLKEIEDMLESAVQNHNVAAVEGVTADDFVRTNSKGRVMNRRAALAEFKSDTDIYSSAKNMGMSVHVAAKNVGIVTGGSREIGKDKAGKAFDRTYRWTDTFVERNGKWMVVATHVTLVASK